MDQEQIQSHIQTVHYESWSERYRAMQELVPYAHQPNVQEALGYGLTHDRKGPEVGEVTSSQRGNEIDVRREVAKALARYADQPLPQKALACVLQEVYALEIRLEEVEWNLEDLRRRKLKARTTYEEVRVSVGLSVYGNMMEHHDTFRSVSGIAFEALAPHADKPDVQTALAHVLIKDSLEAIRLKAAEALAPYAAQAVAQNGFNALAYALAYALKNDSLEEIRRVAAEALAPHADKPDVQKALAYVLKKDSSEAIRLKAAEALAPHAAEDPQINKAMVEAFKSDPVLEVRQVAARAADCSGEDLTDVNFSGLSKFR